MLRYALKLKINMKTLLTKQYFFLNSNPEITSKITSKKRLHLKYLLKVETVTKGS